MGQIGMGKMICVADPPLCLADSMAPLTSLKTATISVAHVTSALRPKRRRSSPHKDALSAHRAFVRGTLELPHVRWVRTMNDLISLPAGNVGILFGLQHAPEGMTKANVGEWRAARLQFMALAYADSNEYGSGFKGHGGLTDRGRNLIEWMSEHNIILDLSHANHQTAREALEFIRQEDLPVYLVASHSGCHSIFPHLRNLPDDILKEIVAQGGYVGIPTITFLLAQDSDDPYLALFRHVAHAIKVCGADNIGIGSGAMCVNFRTLEKRLTRKFSTPAVEGLLGRNFEYFLLRSLP